MKLLVEVWLCRADQEFYDDNVAALLERGIVSDVPPNFAPTGNLTETQAVSIFREDAANQFSIIQFRRFRLNRLHQLTADSIISKRSPHTKKNFRDVRELRTHVIWRKRNPAENPSAQFRNQNRMTFIRQRF